MDIIENTIVRFNLRRFFIGEGPQTQPVILHHRKVYILPTRQGGTFAILLLLMLLGSINYSNSLGYMLTFLLASLAVVTILFTYQNLLNLKVTLGQPEPVFAGAKLSIPFYIENNQQDRFSILISHDKSAGYTTDIPINHYFEFKYTLIAEKRGSHNIPRFTLSTTFPLGLFRAWSYVEIDKHFLVYPKPEGLRQLPEQSFYKATLTGDQGHGSDDFAGQRKYHPGDSLRQINWKALSKEQGLLIKQFGGDRYEELWLDWSHTDGSGIEQRLSQLALWIIEAEHAGIAYGLNMPGQEIPPSHGESHKQQCMKTLALFNND